MLVLAFLVLIGVALVADGFEFHIPRGYIYFAIAFAGAVGAFQRHGMAQPRAAAALLTLDRETLLGDIASAGRSARAGRNRE